MTLAQHRGGEREPERAHRDDDEPEIVASLLPMRRP